MTIIDQIRKDQIESRKNKDILKSNLLTTILGEISRVDKSKQNEDLYIQVLKKMVKDIETVIQFKPSEVAEYEKSIILAYLPKQATEEEILAVIKNCENNLGIIMKTLKEVFGKNFDGKLAKQLFEKGCS